MIKVYNAILLDAHQMLDDARMHLASVYVHKQSPLYATKRWPPLFPRCMHTPRYGSQVARLTGKHRYDYFVPCICGEKRVCVCVYVCVRTTRKAMP
jgi:hypothetical protein